VGGGGVVGSWLAYGFADGLEGLPVASWCVTGGFWGSQLTSESAEDSNYMLIWKQGLKLKDQTVYMKRSVPLQS
jgi:hypothetical protein